MPTDRALWPRPSCSRYIRARGAGPPEAIGEAGGPAPYRPQKSTVTPCSSVSPRPAMATSLRVTNSHGHKPPSRQPKLLW